MGDDDGPDIWELGRQLGYMEGGAVDIGDGPIHERLYKYVKSVRRDRTAVEDVIPYWEEESFRRLGEDWYTEE